MSTSRVTRPWTKSEDNILRNAVSQFNQTETIDWHRVASHLPRRNNKECRKRWVYSLESKICKGPWDEEEDRNLRNGVAKYGLKWAAVAEMVGSRQPDQCSRRWHEVVNPRISHERWSLMEDEILKEAVDTYGRKWTEIVERFFPNRTPISARNRFKQRYEGRSSMDERQSSVSSDEQKRSSLLWTIQDHSQGGTPGYEPPPFAAQMPATTGATHWSNAAPLMESASPHPTNFQADFGHVMAGFDSTQGRAVYPNTHRRTFNASQDVSMRSVADQAPPPPPPGSSHFGAHFGMDDLDLLPEPERASSFESTHAYSSPITSNPSYDSAMSVGTTPHLHHAEPYTYTAAPALHATPTAAVPFHSPDSYAEAAYTDEERRRLASARAQMRQAGMVGARQGRMPTAAATAVRVQPMAY